ncbi:hypothetical protein UA08_03474 [Talaromyces atroroseus]|uniref:ABC transporter domain-containing protein n=1 Tax=Talaromyces atroroseus TaxID=1441469 RepID=A0A225AS24_TALAT|nr:hypothetical protein UA08_03474 [Talaromyces atroroseus]OKL61154.1 hypothetical protein UA08_03474 [Talaromyces atroroseus]
MATFPDAEVPDHSTSARSSPSDNGEEATYSPIRIQSGSSHGQKGKGQREENISCPQSAEDDGNNDLCQMLSRKLTSNSNVGGGEESEEWAEIERLMSRMFGRERKEQSAEEQSRHSGVVWKNLNVKGAGLGAALQPTVGDIFLALPRLVKGFLSRGRKGAGKNVPVKTILHDFTVIGNQRAGYEAIEGDVSYGGADPTTMAKNYRSEVSYNPEEDLHYATLTVKQTLSFALQTRTPGKESRNPGESRTDYQKTFLNAITKLFWIEHTMDTKVGNELIHGISGGEKKRVSIAEAMITKASTQCWDNSTKGLDASTALEYVQSLRSLTNMAQVSTLVALYQAAESLYRLFNKVVLIEEGRCAYYGPIDMAREYFENMGFECPPRWTTPDFLTSVSDPHARRVKAGWEDRIPRTAEEFESIYLKSDLHQAALKDIDDFEQELAKQEKEREAIRDKIKRRNFTLPFHKQVLALTKRQFLVMIGDKQSLYGKWCMIVFQALIVGSLFYNLQPNSAGVFPRGGVMFYILLFNALLALAELTATFSSRPILLKHKAFSFYRPSAYALAQVVVDMPLIAVQVTVFDLIVYFMSNLSRTPSQFFINLLILFVLTLTIYSFFRSIGALCSSLDVATRITGVALQALIVYTGYLIPPWKMHPWLKWLIWINPVQYAFEALMSNEFYNLNIQCISPSLVPGGPDATPQHQSCSIQGSQPDQTVVRGSDYIEAAYTYSRSHLWRNFGIIIAWLIFFVVLTMIGMELQKPNKGGSSVTIFKRGQVPKSIDDAIKNKTTAGDEEATDRIQDGSVNNDTNDGSADDEKSVEGIAKNTAIFTWQHVNYDIQTKGGRKRLLSDVQGYVKPGRLTAMMGASGAGKTTLLNVLAQRVNVGIVQGDFFINGRSLPKSFQRATGFAEQMDVHESTATVRESLRFSAKLRQPREVPLQEKYDYCEKIIDLLEMRPIAGATVGAGGSGLNQEQRKRLTIGVELASKPELLLFLDEPTSGLDSLAAYNIVRFLRRLADAGQAVLCTIHQPSAVLFEQFDDLLLLKSGGCVVYDGELGSDSRALIDYLERNGGKPCPKDANPAEYMLEVIGAGDPNYKGKDWGDVWANSEECKARTREIEEIVRSRRDETAGQEATDDREYAMPVWTQISATTKRSFVAYWRSPEYIIGKFMLHIFTGLFNTFTFWKVGQSYIDMQSRLFSVFMTLTISPPLIQQLQPRYLHFRNLYESREAKAKIYSWPAFVVSAILPEIPYSLVAGSIYFNCWYWGIGYPRDSFTSGFTYIMILLFELYYVSFGQFIAALSPNELFASLIVPAFFTFVVSFCGVVVPYFGLPSFWRAWMYWLTPFHYLLEALLGVLVHGQPVRCVAREEARFTPPSGMTCQSYAGAYTAQAGGYVEDVGNGMCAFCAYSTGDQFAASFNVFYSNKWRDFGIFWGYIVFNFSVIFFLSWLYLHGVQEIKKALSVRKAKAKGNQLHEKTRPESSSSSNLP